jgi:arylsulfatase A-like enzyme
LVSLVDNWFGLFISKLKRLGLFENSIVVFTSDHGTNFTDNPESVIGKPHYSLYPGVMNIPLIIHIPKTVDKGKRFDNLVYNVDISATFYDYAGFNKNEISIDGQSLKDIIADNQWNEREYLTCRYGDTVWYRDRKHWAIIDVSGKPRAIFDIQDDPNCKNNILSESENVVKKAWDIILQDAGGNLPIYDMKEVTDAIGRRG